LQTAIFHVLYFSLTISVLDSSRVLESRVMRQAAKKEMELQRQIEWEQQRHAQLQVLKAKEMGLVERVDKDVSKLKKDLSTLVCIVIRLCLH